MRVYAVWFNMIWFDSRERWPGDVLDDPRVLHFWDERRLVGDFYGAHPDYGAGDSTWWDTYLLYGPEATWEEAPTHLLGMGATILDTRHDLERLLRPFLPERAVTAAP